MTRIKVLDVGQGDSIILSPSSCKFQEKEFLIDVGDGNRNVFAPLDCAKKTTIVLSHAHKDHIGGLIHMIPQLTQIDDIWVPYCASEIIKIGEFLCKLKGASSFSSKSVYTQTHKNSISSAQLCMHLRNSIGKNIQPCHDHMQLCEHVSILNPSLNFYSMLKVDERAAIKFSFEIQTILDRWFEPEHRGMIWGTIVSEGRSYTIPDFVPYVHDYDRRKFIQAFILALKKDIEIFINKPSQHSFDNLMKAYAEKSNKASILLHYSNENCSALFTGDADKSVFNRLIMQKRLPKVKYLKIPHHGSIHNINSKILKNLSPVVAIISHGNGLFGKQRDPHPNKKTLDLLAKLGIRFYLTRESTKGNKKYQKTKGVQDSILEFT